MSDLLQLLEKKLNGPRVSDPADMCSIRTSGDEGQSLVGYAVDVRPGNMLRAQLTWRSRGNIVSCNPKTAARKVRGTLFHVETEFPLELGRNFVPTYRFHADLKCSLATRMANALSSALCTRVTAMETLCPDAPLAFGGGHARSDTLAKQS